MLQPYTALNSTLNTKKAMSVNTLMSQSNFQRILTKKKAITTKLILLFYLSTISGQFKNIRPTVEITSALLNNTCLIHTYIITRLSVPPSSSDNSKVIVSYSKCSVLKLSSLQGLWHVDKVFLLIHFNSDIFTFYLFYFNGNPLYYNCYGNCKENICYFKLYQFVRQT